MTETICTYIFWLQQEAGQARERHVTATARLISGSLHDIISSEIMLPHYSLRFTESDWNSLQGQTPYMEIILQVVCYNVDDETKLKLIAKKRSPFMSIVTMLDKWFSRNCFIQERADIKIYHLLLYWQDNFGRTTGSWLVSLALWAKHTLGYLSWFDNALEVGHWPSDHAACCYAFHISSNLGAKLLNGLAGCTTFDYD